MTAEEIQYAAEIAPGDVDVSATLYAIRHLVGVYCLETGKTPRTVLDDEFTKAPSDEFWRATIGATR
jgi:hypothetical protein